MLTALVLACPVQAQSAESESEKESTGLVTAKPALSGVRLTSSSVSGVSLPPVLYYQYGKGFAKVSIRSASLTQRINFKSGRIQLWAEMPEEVKGDKLVTPDIDIEIPAGTAKKAICILQPLKKSKKSGKLLVSPLFIDEARLPLSGQHIINLSPYPLSLKTSKKGDYSDSVVVKIAPRAKGRNIAPSSMCSFTGKSGEKVAFMLSCKVPSIKEPVRVKSSRFAFSSRQAQISLVFKDPKADKVKINTLRILPPKRVIRK